MNWSRALALGLGAMKAVDTAKELALDRNVSIENTGKSVMSTVIATGGAFYLGRDEPLATRITTALAASGLASTLHELHALVTTAGDRNKAVFMEAVAHRAARTGMPMRTQPGRRTTMPGDL